MNIAPAPTWFDGRVWKRSLTVIEGPPGPGAPRLKRLLLPQGELAHFFDGEVPVQYIAYIEVREGAARGNHFHEFKDEFIYLVSGELNLVVEDRVTHERATIGMSAGDLAFVKAGVAHALKTLVPGHSIEFSPSRFAAGDVHKYAVA